MLPEKLPKATVSLSPTSSSNASNELELWIRPSLAFLSLSLCPSPPPSIFPTQPTAPTFKPDSKTGFPPTPGAAVFLQPTNKPSLFPPTPKFCTAPVLPNSSLLPLATSTAPSQSLPHPSLSLAILL